LAIILQKTLKMFKLAVMKKTKTLSLQLVMQLLLFIIIVPLLPLLISRHWNWWEAWVYAGVYIIGFAVSRILAARRNPDLIAERARFLQHKDALAWDKLLAPLTGLGGGMIPLVAGLDALFNWSPVFTIWVKIGALAFMLAGYTLGTYALIENRFFSGMVRIQTDRGHKVISSGPYAWLRHPGYLGALLTYLATPFFLDSLWTFVPVVFITVVLVIRTALEDRTLQEQLPGYREYAQKVRYRLLPGIW
jgi:protein-S-isoprenylcysteine O-methyltransferase Ste14